jgi:hypothetical protein
MCTAIYKGDWDGGRGKDLYRSTSFEVDRKQGRHGLSLTEWFKIGDDLQAVIDVIKMDIEFSEWLALDHALTSGALTHVRQLMVEFHNDLEVSMQAETALQYLIIN